jgi:hypothetical protein
VSGASLFPRTRGDRSQPGIQQKEHGDTEAIESGTAVCSMEAAREICSKKMIPFGPAVWDVTFFSRSRQGRSGARVGACDPSRALHLFYREGQIVKALEFKPQIEVDMGRKPHRIRSNRWQRLRRSLTRYLLASIKFFAIIDAADSRRDSRLADISAAIRRDHRDVPRPRPRGAGRPADSVDAGKGVECGLNSAPRGRQGGHR